MRTFKSLAVAVVIGIVLLGFAVLVAPTAALADPPVNDPNCRRPCPATKKLHGYTCTFVGCSPEGLCGYAC